MSAELARLPCSEFRRFIHAVLGDREPGTTVPVRVLHPGAFDIVAETACGATIKCASRQAWMEIRSVLLGYAQAIPTLRLRGAVCGQRWSLHVEVA